MHSLAGSPSRGAHAINARFAQVTLTSSDNHNFVVDIDVAKCVRRGSLSRNGGKLLIALTTRVYPCHLVRSMSTTVQAVIDGTLWASGATPMA